MECNNSPASQDCLPGTPAESGVGISDAEYVLYVSAKQSECPQSSGTTTVLAFASACQMERNTDRPIAGYINFCPEALEGADSGYVLSVAQHEMFHALAFSSQLFPYWRDQEGQPRTPRDDSGEPPRDR